MIAKQHSKPSRHVLKLFQPVVQKMRLYQMGIMQFWERLENCLYDKKWLHKLKVPNIMITPVKPPAIQQQLPPKILPSIPELHASLTVIRSGERHNYAINERQSTGQHRPQASTTPVDGSTMSASRPAADTTKPRTQSLIFNC